MEIKKVIGECLVKMGEENFAEEQTLTDEQQELLNKLVCALNIAYREIVSCYLPLVHRQRTTIEDGKISAGSLDKAILYPIEIKQDGRRLSFYTEADGICCRGSGEVEIKYAYMPSEVLTLEASISDIRLTSSALSDGTLAEYYFQEKVFELAKSFDTDFRAQLGLLRYKGRGLRIRARRWQA